MAIDFFIFLNFFIQVWLEFKCGQNYRFCLYFHFHIGKIFRISFKLFSALPNFSAKYFIAFFFVSSFYCSNCFENVFFLFSQTIQLQFWIIFEWNETLLRKMKFKRIFVYRIVVEFFRIFPFIIFAILILISMPPSPYLEIQK